VRNDSVQIGPVMILDQKIEVTLRDAGLFGGNGIGRACLPTGEIEINSRMSEYAIVSTFGHELQHIIADNFTIDLNETQVDCIAAGWTSFIKNNRDFVMSFYYGLQAEEADLSDDENFNR